MDLSSAIDSAYAEAESTEAAAAAIEARIVAFGGRPLLRQYGRPVDAAAIKQNLTLVSQLNRFDPKLATFLGVQNGSAQKLEAEALTRKAASERMAAATEQLKSQNDAAANNRYRRQMAGLNATGGRYI